MADRGASQSGSKWVRKHSKPTPRKRKRQISARQKKAKKQAIAEEQQRQLLADVASKKRNNQQNHQRSATHASTQESQVALENAASEFMAKGYTNETASDFHLRYSELRTPTVHVTRRRSRLVPKWIAEKLLDDSTWNNLSTHTNAELRARHVPLCKLCRRIPTNCECKCSDCKKPLHPDTDANKCQCSCKKKACQQGCK